MIKTSARWKLPSFCPPALILSLLLQASCINMESVTMRPEFAYPQNLVSLCNHSGQIDVANQGIFSTSEWGKSGGNLLLSSQLMPGIPDTQRHLTQVSLVFDSDSSLFIKASGNFGRTLDRRLPEEDMVCSPDGELLLQFPSSSHYFWASVGTKDHELGLWTNPQGGLVIHNRWRETYAGLVGGSVRGDAWALFDPVAPAARQPQQTQERYQPANTSSGFDGCPLLDDDYEPVGQVVHEDGSMAARTAVEQFFREEIVGAVPVNQERTVGTRLTVAQLDQGSISITLYDGDKPLATRLVESGAISCDGNRWHLAGKVQLESAWLLLAASGGAHWENLTLWRDVNGDLLVEGVFKRRVALFLIPMFNIETLFMVFPRVVPPAVP